MFEPSDINDEEFYPTVMILSLRVGFFLPNLGPFYSIITNYFIGGIEMERHVLSVLVRNSSGVLTRVSGLFARRGFNIDSLTVGRTENPEISRMTITLNGNEDVLEQFTKQLNKLEDVLRVLNLKFDNSVYRELVLIKVKADAEQRAAVNEVVKIFRSKIIDISPETLTIELTGDESKISALIRLLEEYEIKELVRTGVCALERGANYITDYCEIFN